MNEQTQPEARFAGLRRQALDIESQLLHLLAGVRAVINEVEEVEREALAEIRRREVVFYTEQEAAEKMRVSLDTLQRQRKAHNLPHTKFGSLVRYTDDQLARVAEILERPRRAKHEGGNISSRR